MFEIKNFIKNSNQRIEQAEILINKIKDKNTTEDIVDLIHAVELLLNNVGGESSILMSVDPSEEVRKTAEQYIHKVCEISNNIYADRKLFDKLNSYCLPLSNQKKKYYDTTIKEYKKTGIDLNSKKRKEIKDLANVITKYITEFDNNISEDNREIFIHASRLVGVPQDWINIRLQEDQTVKVTTDYIDYTVIMEFASDQEIRKQVYQLFNNVAAPQNNKLLTKIIKLRQKLATKLGKNNWSDFETEDDMIKSSNGIYKFLNMLEKTVEERTRTDFKDLQQISNQTNLEAWDILYWKNLLLKSSIGLDSQQLKRYFKYEVVRDAILKTTEKLLGIEFKRENLESWHEEVECYQVYKNNNLFGTVYLDMFPRKDKYSHCAMFDISEGLVGKQTPSLAIVCNFPKPQENDPGLLSHNDVETFWHEFGHAVDSLVRGNDKEYLLDPESDFIEVPSQLYEEFGWDKQYLQTYAKDYQTGEVISDEICDKLTKMRKFQMGYSTSRQLFFGYLSLACYTNVMKQIDYSTFNELCEDIWKSTLPSTYPKDVDIVSSFGHLTGYASKYYTYLWSLVIIKDLVRHINQNGGFTQETFTELVDKVIKKAGQVPVDKLLENYLGRSFNQQAMLEYLKEN